MTFGRGMACCLIAMVVSCGRWGDFYAIAGSRAPNGAVAVVSRDEGGGATVDYTFYVDLYATLRDAQADRGGVEVWGCSGVCPESLTWVPETHRLLIHVRSRDLKDTDGPRMNHHDHFGWKAELRAH